MRHGETAWNRDRRVMSHRPIGLNSRGIDQCRNAAAALRAAGIVRIVSSPLARARESADIVAEAIGLAVEDDTGFCEVNFGHWEGETYDDLIGTPEFEAYVNDPVGTGPPGGESLGTVQQRGLEALERALAGRHDGPVLVVSHGDLIRSLLCHLVGVDLADYRRFTVDNCAVSALDLRNGWSRIRFVNVVSESARLWEPRAAPRAPGTGW
jgi:alpha-ribazole phosphatase/probable phosphoglycerate mutase